MYKFLFTLALLVIFKLTLYSQAEFVPGYILKSEHDTISGWIDYSVNKSNIVKCRFRKTEKDPVQTFLPTEIYGYRFIDSKYYVSREIEINGVPKKIFLEYLVEGTVDLYFYRDITDDHYFLGKNKLPIKEISIPQKIVSVDGKQYERDIFIQRNLVKFYLKDCPELFSEIDQLQACSHKSLIQLIKKYHDIKCPNDICLIYQKKLPKFRVDIQPIFGMTNINWLFGFESNNYTFHCGILSYFWLPLRNEKMFLKTGLIIDQVNGYNLNINGEKIKNSIKIPMQIHYQFLNSDITPVASAGLNIYTTTVPVLILPALSVGVNAKITDNLYATLSADFDYYSMVFVIPFKDTKIASYSLNIGVAVKL